MRFYLILFFCGFGFLFSCGDSKGIPDNVIQEHKMALLLTDIHVVDGTAYNLPPIPDTLAKHGLGLYLAVFKMRHTDTTAFKESLKFYSTRPDLMTEIYNGVVNRLDSIQKAKTNLIKPKIFQSSQKNTLQLADSINKAQIKEKKKADSLRAAQFKKLANRNLRISTKSDTVKTVKAKKHKRKHHKKPIQTNTNAVPPK